LAIQFAAVGRSGMSPLSGLKPRLLQPLRYGLKPVPFKSQSFSGA
jgi:hypothetical protein